MSVYVCGPYNMASLVAIRAAQDRARCDRDNRKSLALDAYRQAYVEAFATHRPADKGEAIEALKLALDMVQSNVLRDGDEGALLSLLPGIVDDMAAGKVTNQTIAALRFAIEVAEGAGNLMTAKLLIGALDAISRPLPIGG